MCGVATIPFVIWYSSCFLLLNVALSTTFDFTIIQTHNVHTPSILLVYVLLQER